MVTKAKPKTKFKIAKKKPSPVAIGVDLSLSSLAISAKMYDRKLDSIEGPVWTLTRWSKEVTLFEKLRQVSKAEDFIHPVLVELNGGFAQLDDIYIGVEELPPRPMDAQRYREQAAIIGAFIGSLLRFRFPHVEFVNARSWQALIAREMGMKLTMPKTAPEDQKFNKWTVKEWTRKTYDAPKWKDLIYNAKLGLIPKPKGSKAMPKQPDDRYDACGIMEYVWGLIDDEHKF